MDKKKKTTTVFANGMGVTHKDSGGICSGGPDYCLTRVGQSLVPVPYTNTARSQDLENGSISVRIQGQPAAVAGSCYARSTGNEAGERGVGSGTIQGRGQRSKLIPPPCLSFGP